MKEGDILVFKEDWVGHYSTGDVLYPRGSLWLIEKIHSFTGNEPFTASIRNLDNRFPLPLFVFGEIWDRLVTLEEWRDEKLNQILDE